MEELFLRDRGGNRIRQDELVSEKLLKYIEGLNPVLGTEADPHYPDYQEFIKELNSMATIKIDPESMSSGKYDDLDLNVSENSEIVELQDNKKSDHGNGLEALLMTQMSEDMEFALKAMFWQDVFSEKISNPVFGNAATEYAFDNMTAEEFNKQFMFGDGGFEFFKEI